VIPVAHVAAPGLSPGGRKGVAQPPAIRSALRATMVTVLSAVVETFHTSSGT